MIKVKTRVELENLIKERISEQGLECDLNDINVSEIEDMSYLFCQSKFNGDISKWDVSNVLNMDYMFADSLFSGDISNWNICKVLHMKNMFAFSKFNGDISKWNVSEIVERDKDYYMFAKANNDLRQWNEGKYIERGLFYDSNYVAKSYNNFKVNLNDFQSLVKSIEELESTPNIKDVLSCKKDLTYLEYCYLQSNGDVETIIRSHLITSRIQIITSTIEEGGN